MKTKKKNQMLSEIKKNEKKNRGGGQLRQKESLMGEEETRQVGSLETGNTRQVSHSLPSHDNSY